MYYTKQYIHSIFLICCTLIFNKLINISLFQTTTISLSDLMAQKGQIPYTKSVKAKVIDTDPEHSYTNERNESRILKNCVIADEGKAVLCVVYDQTKFPRFREGSSVILRNVIKKPDGVAVTSNTKVFPCAEVSVPEHIVNQAKNLLHPPPAPTKTVSEALNSPPKERVSIKGTITQVRHKLYKFNLTFCN